MERLPYRKKSRWSIQRAGSIVLLGISLYIATYIANVVVDTYMQTKLNAELKEEKERLIYEKEILKEINRRLEDTDYAEAYLNVNQDEIIRLPK